MGRPRIHPIVEKVVQVRVCQWCEKEFTPPNGHAPLYCSDECRKEARRAYNTAYQQSRRAGMTDEELQPNRDISRRVWANRVWDTWSREADKILALAKGENAKIALTKYLNDNLRYLAKNQQAPDLSILEIAATADQAIAKSLGN